MDTKKQNLNESTPAVIRAEHARAKVSNGWLVLCYCLPLLIMLPFTNEAGWYGTGVFGLAQRAMQIGVFWFGTIAAFYVLFRGTTWQRLSILPLVLASIGLIASVIFQEWARLST